MGQVLKSGTFVPLFAFADLPVIEDVVYAQPTHQDNHFGALYHPQARVWMHEDMACVALLAAVLLHRDRGWKLKVNDCLRSVEAQEKMLTKGFDPSLVSVPGSGAHPRGMAIDVEPMDRHGGMLDMGTRFDHFATDLSDNPADRAYTRFSNADQIIGHRRALTDSFHKAARMLRTSILPVPQEWWDYRLKPDKWEPYAAVREDNMPGYMRCVHTEGEVDMDRHTDAIRRVRAALAKAQARGHGHSQGR